MGVLLVKSTAGVKLIPYSTYKVAGEIPPDDILASVIIDPAPYIPPVKTGAFGLVIRGPWQGYKIKITGHRGQVLPQSVRYVYEARVWNINDIHTFDMFEAAFEYQDVVPYTIANKLLYG